MKRVVLLLLTAVLLSTTLVDSAYKKGSFDITEKAAPHDRKGSFDINGKDPEFPVTPN